MTPAEFHSIRKALGLTQPALAAKLDLSHFTISRFENGHQAIPVAVALAMKAMEKETGK